MWRAEPKVEYLCKRGVTVVIRALRDATPTLRERLQQILRKKHESFVKRTYWNSWDAEEKPQTPELEGLSPTWEAIVERFIYILYALNTFISERQNAELPECVSLLNLCLRFCPTFIKSADEAENELFDHWISQLWNVENIGVMGCFFYVKKVLGPHLWNGVQNPFFFPRCSCLSLTSCTPKIICFVKMGPASHNPTQRDIVWISII